MPSRSEEAKTETVSLGGGRSRRRLMILLLKWYSKHCRPILVQFFLPGVFLFELFAALSSCAATRWIVMVQKWSSLVRQGMLCLFHFLPCLLRVVLYRVRLLSKPIRSQISHSKKTSKERRWLNECMSKMWCNMVSLQGWRLVCS